jgi:hypothetical protein
MLSRHGPQVSSRALQIAENLANGNVSGRQFRCNLMQVEASVAKVRHRHT